MWSIFSLETEKRIAIYDFTTIESARSFAERVYPRSVMWTVEPV